MGINKSFPIKVKNDYNGEHEIIINKKDTIKDVKRRICVIQDKIDIEYMIIYKDNQLLDEEKNVSSYHITPSDILTYKSSRKDEFLVFFEKYGKLVTKEEKIDNAFQQLKKYFRKSKYGDQIKLFYKGIELYKQETFQHYNIQENAHIVVETIPNCG